MGHRSGEQRIVSSEAVFQMRFLFGALLCSTSHLKKKALLSSINNVLPGEAYNAYRARIAHSYLKY